MEEKKTGTQALTPAKPDMSRVLELAQKAGQILLENGAEIARVEETMERIAACYGVTNEEFFVLSTGIFMTGNDPEQDKVYARVKFIPMKGTQFYKLTQVNQLSREITAGKYTVEEALAELDRINEAPGEPNWLQILAAGVSASGFGIVFGGSLMDSIPAFITGLLVYLYILYIAAPRFSKITTNLLGGALATIISICLFQLGLGEHLSSMVIGSIVPMIPGVAFVNGARDLADGDYISGTVRILDAVIGFLSIAIGVGVVYMLYHSITGGVL